MSGPDGCPGLLSSLQDFWTRVQRKFRYHPQRQRLKPKAIISRQAFLEPCFQSRRFRFVIESPCLFGAGFSATKTQVCRRIAFLGLGFDSTLSSPYLFGARFSAAMVQLYRRLTFLGPVELSNLLAACSSNPFIHVILSTLRARFSAATVQLYRRLTFLGPAFRPSRFNFVVESPCFLGQVPRTVNSSDYSYQHQSRNRLLNYPIS
jgi:hypothetical protein